MAGNANSGSWTKKPFRDALRLELAAAGEDHKALRAIARNLIAMAQGDDMQAIKELADRMDGKPAQALVGGDDDDNPIKMLHKIERLIVDPSNPDS